MQCPRAHLTLTLMFLWMHSYEFLRNDLKYILLWTPMDWAPFNINEEGQSSFHKNNCSHVNCYVTANKSFFGRDYTEFFAIAINGKNMQPNNRPRVRSPHQRYIFFNMDSSAKYPVCHSIYDKYFNLTATYKLNSDIPLPHLGIRDNYGELVGPQKNMHWKHKDQSPEIDGFFDEMGNKTKIAAWFDTDCNHNSRVSQFVRNLSLSLQPFSKSYVIDKFGDCHSLKYPGYSDAESMLKKNYFFYLALEDTFVEDFVSGKLLQALKSNVVPIVLGGADYSRFVPPGSYIDASLFKDLDELAELMDRLIRSPGEYSKYFHWQKFYTYFNPTLAENLCRVCEALNDEYTMNSNKIYENFRAWWNPNYKELCGYKI